VREWLEDGWADATDWCAERSAWPRLPLLLYLGYAGIRHLADAEYRSWFAGLTLVLHEMGHLLFSWFGNTLMLLGGSIVQLAAPLGAALYLLLRQRDWFGLSVGLGWLSFATWELATYLGDANNEDLPLVGFGDEVQHDWSTLLTGWHLLNYADGIAVGIRVVATLLWLTAMVLGGVLCALMIRRDLGRRSA
jgi:hypothetical protein